VILLLETEVKLTGLVSILALLAQDAVPL